jgi:hypothetical protein
MKEDPSEKRREKFKSLWKKKFPPPKSTLLPVVAKESLFEIVPQRQRHFKHIYICTHACTHIHPCEEQKNNNSR